MPSCEHAAGDPPRDRVECGHGNQTVRKVHVRERAQVRLLAAELGISLERVTLDFRTGDFRSPEHLARNPNGKVPTLDHDGFVLWESGAILEYLAAQRPERGMAPSGASPDLTAWLTRMQARPYWKDA